MKGNKGITLIALVVTTVILTILATVSVNLIFDENGIISKVESAKRFQTNAEAIDSERIESYKEHITSVTNEKEKNYTYVCPYCDVEHSKFNGGAIVYMYEWLGYGEPACSCGWTGGEVTSTGPNCPECGKHIENWEIMQQYYITTCCNKNVGFMSPDEDEWKKVSTTNSINENEYIYICPHCEEEHEQFDGEAVISMVTWLALDNCSCEQVKQYGEYDTTVANEGKCSECGTYVYHEVISLYYKTGCCNKNLGTNLPNEKEWKKEK